MTRLNKEWFREERKEKSSSDSRSTTKMLVNESWRKAKESAERKVY